MRFIKIGGIDLMPEEAVEMDLPVRQRWQMWAIEVLGRGISLMVREKPL